MPGNEISSTIKKYATNETERKKQIQTNTSTKSSLGLPILWDNILFIFKYKDLPFISFVFYFYFYFFGYLGLFNSLKRQQTISSRITPICL